MEKKIRLSHFSLTRVYLTFFTPVFCDIRMLCTRNRICMIDFLCFIKQSLSCSGSLNLIQHYIYYCFGYFLRKQMMRLIVDLLDCYYIFIYFYLFDKSCNYVPQKEICKVFLLAYLLLPLKIEKVLFKFELVTRKNKKATNN